MEKTDAQEQREEIKKRLKVKNVYGLLEYRMGIWMNIRGRLSIAIYGEELVKDLYPLHPDDR